MFAWAFEAHQQLQTETNKTRAIGKTTTTKRHKHKLRV